MFVPRQPSVGVGGGAYCAVQYNPGALCLLHNTLMLFKAANEVGYRTCEAGCGPIPSHLPSLLPYLLSLTLNQITVVWQAAFC